MCVFGLGGGVVVVLLLAEKSLYSSKDQLPLGCFGNWYYVVLLLLRVPIDAVLIDPQY